MLLQGIVVLVIVRLSGILSVADEAALVLHAAMLVQLVAVVEALAAEAAERMATETSLISRAGLVVAMTHVLFKLALSKELMFVGEDFLVSRAQVAHALLMHRFDVAVQIRPSVAGKVAVGIWAVVSEKQNGVANDFFAGVVDADMFVCGGDFAIFVVVEPSLWLVCKDDVWSSSLKTKC